VPRYVNSLDKIIFSYMAAICKEPFTYNGQEVQPKPLQVSPLIFRGFTCPANCGGCCPRFSLEYLPTEPRPKSDKMVAYTVSINSKDIVLYHDPQADHNDHHCRHLCKDDGRCLVHSKRPFHCDFELIRVFIKSDGIRMSQQMFGRGWAFLRIDGNRGALCTITEPDTESVDEVVRKLKRLKEWADHFELVTWLDDIISWAATGPHSKPLYLTTKRQLESTIKVK